MPLSNTERQKRWIAKNRALHNLRRRKKNLNGHDTSRNEASSNDLVEKRHSEDNRSSPVQLSRMDELRQMVKMVSAEPVVPAMKPLVYRDDDGRVITENHWNKLQDLKQKAKEGGYHLDKYIQ